MKTEKLVFPLFFKHPNKNDYWKIDSFERGHFIRNMITVGNGYCYQCSDEKEDMIALLLKDESLIAIDEKTYLEALKVQTKRNSMILLKIQDKLLEI